LILTPTRYFFLGAGGQLVSDFPELRVRRLRHEPSEELDGCPLRTDDAVADHARHDLVVAHPPELCLLVQPDEGLRELVELLVVAALDVELHEREPGSAPRGVERLTQAWEDATQLVPARRVEARPVSEYLANLLVLPR
jgi:hypothetical protein